MFKPGDIIKHTRFYQHSYYLVIATYQNEYEIMSLNINDLYVSLYMLSNNNDYLIITDILREQFIRD